MRQNVYLLTQRARQNVGARPGRGLGVGALQATEDGYPVYRRLGFIDHDTYGIHLLLPQDSDT